MWRGILISVIRHIIKYRPHVMRPVIFSGLCHQTRAQVLGNGWIRARHGGGRGTVFGFVFVFYEHWWRQAKHVNHYPLTYSSESTGWWRWRKTTCLLRCFRGERDRERVFVGEGQKRKLNTAINQGHVSLFPVTVIEGNLGKNLFMPARLWFI